MEQKNKPKVEFNSNSPTGNLFCILGNVRIAMQKEQRIVEYNDLRELALKQRTYIDALRVIREHVDLIDLSRRR